MNRYWTTAILTVLYPTQRNFRSAIFLKIIFLNSTRRSAKLITQYDSKPSFARASLDHENNRGGSWSISISFAKLVLVVSSRATYNVAQINPFEANTPCHWRCIIHVCKTDACQLRRISCSNSSQYAWPLEHKGTSEMSYSSWCSIPFRFIVIDSFLKELSTRTHLIASIHICVSLIVVSLININRKQPRTSDWRSHM